MTRSAPSSHVLVTGAGGFAAKQIVRELSRRGHQVSALFRSEENARKSDLPKGAEPVICDLSQGTNGLASSYDAVVHTAANAPPRPSIPSLLYRDNIVATKSLLDHLSGLKACKLIFFSSLSVYGQIEDEVVDEDTAIRNPDPYGQSKLFCEEMIRELSGSLPSVSLRLPGLIGAGLVETGAGPFLARALRSFRAGEEVSAFNPDARFNNALDVDDLAGFTAELVERALTGANTLTLTSSGMIKVKDALRILQDESGVAGLLRIVPGVKPSFTISAKHAEENFSFSPKSIEQALTDFAKRG